MGNKLIYTDYNGIEDTDNALSGDSMALCFDITEIVKFTPRGKVVIPLEERGESSMIKTLNVKAIGSFLLALFSLFSLWSLATGKPFTTIGSIVIFIISVVASYIFWSEARATEGRG